VAVAAARRGARVALAGGAGADDLGEWLRDRLAAEGVELDWFDLVWGTRTPVALLTADDAGHPRASVYGEGARAAVTALGERLDDAVDACDALLLTSGTMVEEDERAATLAARDRALAAGKPVVFDPALRVDRWPTAAAAVREVGGCVQRAFLVSCSAEEARQLTGELDPVTAAESLVAAGAEHAVVKLGEGGAILRGGGMRLEVPGVAAAPVDRTGAGDVVTGVVLAGLAATGFYPAAIGAALPQAVEAAARATERWGAQ
ncbi:MAG: hypothetical protein HZB46_00345, partial [Solirubrobacterales bacterium]|nr:hypothetical protein [Solirubrobacterales bacterium]